MLRTSVLWHKQDVNKSNFLCILVPLLARFQATAAKQPRTAPCWVIMQPVVVSSYRRFGTTYRFHPQGSRNKKILRLETIGFPETSVRSRHYLLRNYPEQFSSQFRSLFRLLAQMRLWQTSLLYNVLVYTR